jgi:hypothetical protein
MTSARVTMLASMYLTGHWPGGGAGHGALIRQALYLKPGWLPDWLPDPFEFDLRP